MNHLMSPDDVQHLATLIRDGHLKLAVTLFGVDAVAPSQLARLRAAGLLTDDDVRRVGRYGTIGAAYNTGAAMAHAPEVADRTSPPIPPLPRTTAPSRPGAPQQAPEQGAPRSPVAPAGAGAGAPPGGATGADGMIPDDDLPAWQRRYAEAARQHGAQMVVGLGNRTADRVAGDAFEVDLDQEVELRRRTAETIAQGIESGESAGSTAAKLGRALDDDWTRDLGRIVMTETQAAVNAGYKHAVLDEIGDDALVAVIPDAGACAVCRRLYLERGKPRIFKAAALPPATVNYGVKAADKVPCVPPMHPWCACQLVYVEPGWSFNDEWQLLPPGVE